MLKILIAVSLPGRIKYDGLLKVVQTAIATLHICILGVVLELVHIDMITFGAITSFSSMSVYEGSKMLLHLKMLIIIINE